MDFNVTFAMIHDNSLHTVSLYFGTEMKYYFIGIKWLLVAYNL